MMLDGKEFIPIAGEIHPSRIPYQYWRHRIQMTKAMGCNTLSVYVLWNVHEEKEYIFDFQDPQKDIKQFFKIAQEEGLFILLRPGPYVCAEEDFGGIPPYLLKDKDLKIRTISDINYKNAVERYIQQLAPQFINLMWYNGGNILMVQIENEYGHWPANRQDKSYIEWLEQQWRQVGVTGPFYTADSPWGYNDKTFIKGAAFGLDGSKLTEADWSSVNKFDSNLPSFNAEMYSGWLRHWGEKPWVPEDRSEQIKDHLSKNRGFSFYMVHGGTNFGKMAGANGELDTYQPALTSYDYGAPINEQGNAVANYHKYREIIFNHLKQTAPEIPKPIPTISIDKISVKKYATIWGQYFDMTCSDQGPVWFETYGQNQGYIHYQTHIDSHEEGILKFQHIADYAQIYLNGSYIGTMDTQSQKVFEVKLAACSDTQLLDIIVEATGHKNYGTAMEQDRKGIWGDVTMNGKTIDTFWVIFRLEIDHFPKIILPNMFGANRKGGIYRSRFNLTEIGDTFIDFSKYVKGTVWINGKMLGRYWNIGPQKSLYVPGVWLQKENNDLIIIENVIQEAIDLRACKTPEECL